MKERKKKQKGREGNKEGGNKERERESERQTEKARQPHRLANERRRKWRHSKEVVSEQHEHQPQIVADHFCKLLIPVCMSQDFERKPLTSRELDEHMGNTTCPQRLLRQTQTGIGPMCTVSQSGYIEFLVMLHPPRLHKKHTQTLKLAALSQGQWPPGYS